MIDSINDFVEAGFAIHWLHPRGKNPIGERWQTKPVATLDQLRASYRDGNNVGVRLGEYSTVAGGYLHVLDIDIREPRFAKDAWRALAKLLPDVDFASLPSVISGSGGESRHLYVISDHAFKKSKLARSDGFKMVFDPKKGREVKKRDWEIDLFGTGVQVAMPPSIHPDTGKPYRWEREFDFDLLAIGIGPFVSSRLLDGVASRPDEDSENFGANTQKLGLTIEEAENILARLPTDYWCEDRDGWCAAGMALKHEFGEDGYALWTEFSMQSKKFDARNQRTVWKSFRGKTARPIRMATLKDAAKTASMIDSFDDLDEPEDPDDDFDDLIGPSDDDDFDSKPPPSKLEWTSLLDPLEDGKGWRPTLHNVELIVKNDPRLIGLAQLNEFTQETVQRTPPGEKRQRKNAAKDTRQLSGRVWQVRDQLNGELWSDDRDFAIRSILEAPRTQGGYSMKVTDRDLKASIVLAANENAFHPVREYLERVEWDGQLRAERLFIDYLGAEDNAYSRSVGRILLTAAVTRIFEPGHKYDFAVIMEGLQGKRKSTFIEVLGRKWFAELDGDFHDPKQMVELMQGAWIMEIPELSGFGRADVRSIKAFISRRKDRARLAYARRAGEFPRQCIFIGSTNDREYLKDDTGGRRFWPMHCLVDEIDTAALERNIDQIWAEAVMLYREMRAEQPHGTLPLYLRDPEAKAIAARLQESRRVESADDVLAGRIAEWLDKPINDGGFDDTDEAGMPRHRDETCSAQIWVECLGGDPRSFKTVEQGMVNRALLRVPGWAADGTSRRFANYGKQRVFYRGGEAGKLERMGLGDLLIG